MAQTQYRKVDFRFQVVFIGKNKIQIVSDDRNSDKVFPIFSIELWKSMTNLLNSLNSLSMEKPIQADDDSN